MTRVTLYTKPDCCLCDEAREAIQRVQQELSIELEQVDITHDPALTARYGERIPVVVVGGVEAFEYRVDEHQLRSAIAGRAEAAALSSRKSSG